MGKCHGIDGAHAAGIWVWPHLKHLDFDPSGSIGQACRAELDRKSENDAQLFGVKMRAQVALVPLVG